MLGLDNPLHIAIVLIVVLLVFGAKRLPDMGKSLGEGLRGFKASVGGESYGGSYEHQMTVTEPASAQPDSHIHPVAERTPAQPAA